MKRSFYYHPRFNKAYSKLSDIVKQKAKRREKIFRKDPFDARLDTHRLHGKLKDFWSFAVDNKYRVLFEFNGDDIIFLDIDDHDIYK